MKNLLLLLSCFLFGMHGFAQGGTTPQNFTSESEVEILPFKLNSGEEKTIQVLLNAGPNNWFTQGQLDLVLPEGITVKKKKIGPKSFLCIDKGSITQSHSIGSSNPGPNLYRAVISSSDGMPFYPATGDLEIQKGDIVNITLVASSDLKSGIYEIKLTSVKFSRGLSGSDSGIDQDRPADYTTSVITGTPSEPNIALKGHFTSEAATAISGALTNDAITTVDLSQATTDANTTFTTGNPNTLYYVAEGMNLGNTNNVVVGNTCASLNLVDGKNFSVLNNFTAQQATYTRNITNEGWYSVCLPFAAEIPSNTTVEEFASYNSATNSVQFNNATTMSAGNAYIFKAAAPTTFSATNVLVSDITKKVVGADSFNGTFTNMAAGSVTGKYALRNDGSGFGTCTATAFVPAFHAYLDVPAKSQSIKLNHDGVTAIEGIETEEIKFPADVYTLDGKLVKKQAKDLSGMPKGVYVVNNTKVIK